jgi:hypothetical protein
MEYVAGFCSDWMDDRNDSHQFQDQIGEGVFGAERLLYIYHVPQLQLLVFKDNSRCVVRRMGSWWCWASFLCAQSHVLRDCQVF